MSLEIKSLRGNINKDDKDLAKFITSLYDETVRMFSKQHREWYINERFARGDHWIVYNKTMNKIQSLPTGDGEVRRTINKVGSQLRGFKNFVKRNQPRWEVQPDDVDDESLKYAQQKNKILQNIYRTRQIPVKLTDIIVNSWKFSVGILEGGVIKKEGRDYLDFWVDDTFDVVFDPMATTLQNCRFIIKAFKKPINTIKETYKIDKVVPDNKEAASQYKELLENEKYNRAGSRGSGDLETAIVKEIWLKWEEGSDIKVRVITSLDTQVLKIADKSYRRYPFFTYNPEKASNSIYSTPWIKDLISTNKSLDKVASLIETYIQRMLAGKYLIKQGVDVSSISDKGAEKIYYKGSTPPLQQNLQPLPEAPFVYLANCERWIEEKGGIREATLGRTPRSVQSGKAIEALQAADAGTVAEPIENLEYMLADIGEFCLEVIADYNLASEEIIEGGEKIKYIGNVQSPPENTLVVKPSKVKVVIVPEISYTEESRKEWLMELAKAGLVDQQTVLEKLSISNISDIIERVQKNKAEQYKQDIMMQQASHATAGAAQPQDSADLAHQENMSMAAGQKVPDTPRALWVKEHTDLHLKFVSDNKDAYKQHQDLFDSHIQAEQGYGQESPSQPAQAPNQQPIQQPVQQMPVK